MQATTAPIPGGIGSHTQVGVCGPALRHHAHRERFCKHGFEAEREPSCTSRNYPAQQSRGRPCLSTTCYRLGRIPAVFPIRPTAPLQALRSARARARASVHSTPAICHCSTFARAAPPGTSPTSRCRIRQFQTAQQDARKGLVSHFSYPLRASRRPPPPCH